MVIGAGEAWGYEEPTRAVMENGVVVPANLAGAEGAFAAAGEPDWVQEYRPSAELPAWKRLDSGAGVTDRLADVPFGHPAIRETVTTMNQAVRARPDGSLVTTEFVLDADGRWQPETLIAVPQEEGSAWWIGAGLDAVNTAGARMQKATEKVVSPREVIGRVHKQGQQALREGNPDPAAPTRNWNAGPGEILRAAQEQAAGHEGIRLDFARLDSQDPDRLPGPLQGKADGRPYQQIEALLDAGWTVRMTVQDLGDQQKPGTQAYQQLIPVEARNSKIVFVDPITAGQVELYEPELRMDLTSDVVVTPPRPETDPDGYPPREVLARRG